MVVNVIVIYSGDRHGWFRSPAEIPEEKREWHVLLNHWGVMGRNKYNKRDPGTTENTQKRILKIPM